MRQHGGLHEQSTQQDVRTHRKRSHRKRCQQKCVKLSSCRSVFSESSPHPTPACFLSFALAAKSGRQERAIAPSWQRPGVGWGDDSENTGGVCATAWRSSRTKCATRRTCTPRERCQHKCVKLSSCRSMYRHLYNVHTRAIHYTRIARCSIA